MTTQTSYFIRPSGRFLDCCTVDTEREKVGGMAGRRMKERRGQDLMSRSKNDGGEEGRGYER